MNGNKIWRANLDGTNARDIVSGFNHPVGMALDRTARKVYWADSGNMRVARSNLDRSGREDVVARLGSIFRIDFVRNVTDCNGIFNPDTPSAASGPQRSAFSTELRRVARG